MQTEPQGHTYAEQIAWRMQGLLIHAAVKAGKSIPAVPTLEQIAADLKILLEKQKSEIRLALIMEIVSPKAAVDSRGLLLNTMAAQERQRIADLSKILEREQKREAGSELELEGGENSTMYPPKS